MRTHGSSRLYPSPTGLTASLRPFRILFGLRDDVAAMGTKAVLLTKQDLSALVKLAKLSDLT